MKEILKKINWGMVFYTVIFSVIFLMLGFYVGNFFNHYKEVSLVGLNTPVYLEYGKFYKDLHNLTLYEFEFEVKQNYVYGDLTDCKFYSMVWYDYFINNDWEVDFITTNKHIQTMAWKDNKICFGDLDRVICRSYIFN